MMLSYCQRFNAPGGCPRGTACDFKHPTQLCEHFARGHCRRGPACTFIHPAAASDTTTTTATAYCPHFNKPGGCRYGASCRLKHPTVPCRHFQRGRCNKGSACTFAHTHDGGSAGTSTRSRVQTRLVSERTERAPFEATFLFDVSSSMRGPAIEACKEALLDIAGIMRPQDKVGVSTFGSTLQEVLPLQPKAQHGDGLAQAVATITANGRTALWDSIVLTLGRLRAQGKVTRKLFVLTDGDDTTSTSTGQQCREAVSRPGFVVEIILVAVTRGMGADTQATLQVLGSGKPHYKYVAVRDVGNIVEGLRFFRESVVRETTVVREQVAMVPRVVSRSTTTRRDTLGHRR